MDLNMPPGLSELGQQAWKAIVAEAVDRGLDYTGGCRAFYSPGEWSKRGERWGGNSELVIVYDGGDLGKLFSMDADMPNHYRNVDAMNARLEVLGLYTEECTNWYSSVHKILQP